MNHFIEVNKDSKGNIYIVIHTGSRYLGKQVATYYQNLAYKKLSKQKEAKDELIASLKAAGREKDIQEELKKIHSVKIRKDLAYLEKEDYDDYMHDIDLVQNYSHLNRAAILQSIMKAMDFHFGKTRIESIHNYIEVAETMLRKGAISAYEGEDLIIPINMRDGSIIGKGKGNEDWNYSAPHGAGRLMSRSKAKEILNMEDYKKEMEGIYSTSVKQSTLDEAPMAYKPIDEILENIKDTVDIIEIIKPIYSFKASEEPENKSEGDKNER